MNRDDIKAVRRARRAAAMADAEGRATWSGGPRRIPNKKRQAARRACRGPIDWRSA